MIGATRSCFARFYGYATSNFPLLLPICTVLAFMLSSYGVKFSLLTEQPHGAMHPLMPLYGSSLYAVVLLVIMLIFGYISRNKALTLLPLDLFYNTIKARHSTAVIVFAFFGVTGLVALRTWLHSLALEHVDVGLAYAIMSVQLVFGMLITWFLSKKLPSLSLWILAVLMCGAISFVYISYAEINMVIALIDFALLIGVALSIAIMVYGQRELAHFKTSFFSKVFYYCMLLLLWSVTLVFFVDSTIFSAFFHLNHHTHFWLLVTAISNILIITFVMEALTRSSPLIVQLCLNVVPLSTIYIDALIFNINISSIWVHVGVILSMIIAAAFITVNSRQR